MDTKFKIPKNYIAGLPMFSLPDLGMEVSMSIAGGLHRASLGASRSALEAEFRMLGGGEV